MAQLQLHALDPEDLTVVSAHCQDAVVRVADMVFLKGERRFALVCNRFDWAAAAQRPSWKFWQSFERHRAGLRFDTVTRVQVHGVKPPLSAPSTYMAASAANTAGPQPPLDTLTLLAVVFKPDSVAADGRPSPSGQITLSFGGGAAVRLDVDCIEVELRDLGAVWSTTTKPDHDKT